MHWVIMVPKNFEKARFLECWIEQEKWTYGRNLFIQYDSGYSITYSNLDITGYSANNVFAKIFSNCQRELTLDNKNEPCGGLVCRF